MDGTASPDEYIWLKRKIDLSDEALAEAYIRTDYSKLSQTNFENVLKKYSLFKYMDENGLLEVWNDVKYNWKRNNNVFNEIRN